ncbi:serrate RNA effector molecule homolog [Panthera pardus]|uniref:Serrate RNA effector molecule homolog n=1 Tax=Panthera pardus TaxID=9691 RepID=A0A9V1G7T7_PANPR|nr:serrate RNA effector molecule homolog [Panthera pardus]
MTSPVSAGRLSRAQGRSREWLHQLALPPTMQKRSSFQEVAPFNNFLTDAKHPALPEIKPVRPAGPAQMLRPGLTPALPSPYWTPRGLMPPILGYGAGAVRPAVPTLVGPSNYDASRGQGGCPGKPWNRMVGGDPRAAVECCDQDAPDDGISFKPPPSPHSWCHLAS